MLAQELGKAQFVCVQQRNKPLSGLVDAPTITPSIRPQYALKHALNLGAMKLVPQFPTCTSIDTQIYCIFILYTNKELHPYHIRRHYRLRNFAGLLEIS